MLACLIVVPPGEVVAADYLSQLTERSHRERLAERPEWRALLHYVPLWLSAGLESQVDAESFFLSPDGKRDPQAELDATLAALAAGDDGDPEQSAQCTFPARYQWLKEELEFDSDRLPELPCRRFHRWLTELQPHRLTLIFPASYLNNPASMFGHTLLRIDSRVQDEQTRLLDYTINYAADSQQQHGMSFAFKGLFGLYRGMFFIAPYYLKVKTYGDIENRDIWEYGLNLTEDEIDRLLRHVWEMRSAWFDYYFLDENCSYHLLSLLEASRPGLRLTDPFTGWAIPSETVRAVAEAGLLKEVRFRPARNTMLRERASRLAGGQQDLARLLTLGKLRPDAEEMVRLSPEDRARVIELAIDYAAYLQNSRFGGAPPDTGTVATLLEARSRVAVPDQSPVIQAPDVPPGQGHKPARAGIGYGLENHRQFIEISGGPAYHALFDPQGGFTPGAQVIVLHSALRYYPEEGRLEIERIDALDVMSLAPWGPFLHPVSWKLNLGLVRKYTEESRRRLLGRYNGGFGITRDVSPRTSFHAFAEGTVEMGGHFDHFVAPGVGPGIGMLHDFSDRWRTGLFFDWRHFFLGESRSDYRISAIARFALDGESTLGLDLSWNREFDHGFPEGKLYWRIYF